MHYSSPAIPEMQPVEPGRLVFPAHEGPLHFIDIQTSGWTHAASARFGEARPSKVGEWSGDSFRYDIFFNEGNFAIRRIHGAGVRWYICLDESDRGVDSLLSVIADMPDEARRWDACQFLVETMDRTEMAARYSEALRWRQAIAEKRVVSHKVRGQNLVRVSIKEICQLGDYKGPVATTTPKDDNPVRIKVKVKA